jgi:hypothetical protein
MTTRRAFAAALFMSVTCAGTVFAQEGAIAADVRREREALHQDCIENKAIIGCATTLFTGDPLHVATGTIAPQNGMGFGPTIVWHWTPSNNWRWTGSADGVAASGGAWRVGSYATIVRTAVDIPREVAPGSPRRRQSRAITSYPVIKLYTQAISLPQVSFFGLGPNTTLAGKTFFGMRETVAGASTIWPITPDNNFDRLRLSLFGEVNGRWVDVRNGPSGDVPSIGQLYTDATAPGLSSQPGFIQFGEGVRISPSLIGGHLRLSYAVRYQQYQAPSDSLSSFQRWSVDLRHEIPLFGSSIPAARDTNGPNECAIAPRASACPQVAAARGAVAFGRVRRGRRALLLSTDAGRFGSGRQSCAGQLRRLPVSRSAHGALPRVVRALAVRIADRAGALRRPGQREPAERGAQFQRPGAHLRRRPLAARGRIAGGPDDICDGRT